MEGTGRHIVAKTCDGTIPARIMVSGSSAESSQNNPVNPYHAVIAAGIPRLLALLDRLPLRDTLGCADRYYWHYRNLTGTTSAIYQECALSLALLWRIEWPENCLVGRADTLTWANGSMRWWTKIQHTDGSFDEWYSYERSFVATAFSAFAIANALSILGSDVPEDLRIQVVRHLALAGSWLARHRDRGVANHTAGAVAALAYIARVTSDSRFERAASKQLEWLRQQQDSEGWFLEYGGFDLGYQSLSIDYLTAYYRLYPRDDVYAMLERAVLALEPFVLSDGSSGGPYGSRGTQFLSPWGLEELTKEFHAASSILSRFYQGINTGRVVTPMAMDDRYFIMFLSKYLKALSAYKVRGEATEMASGIAKPSFVFYPRSGTFAVKNDRYNLVGNTKQGGCFSLVIQQRPKWIAYDDAGYFARTTRGGVWATQWFNPRGLYVGPAYNQINSQMRETKMIVRTPFVAINDYRLKGWNRMPLQLFAMGAGKMSGKLAEYLSQFLKWWLIQRVVKCPLGLERTFCFGEQYIIVTDILTNMKRRHLRSCVLGHYGTTRFVPSSQAGRLGIVGGVIELTPTVAAEMEKQITAKLNDIGVVTITRKVHVVSSRSFEIKIDNELIGEELLKGGQE